MTAADNLMSFEDFQKLTSEKQSEEIFKLLSMLRPFASEVSGLKNSVDAAKSRIADLEIGINIRPMRTFRVGAGSGSDENNPATMQQQMLLQQPSINDPTGSPQSNTPLLGE